MKKYIIFFFLIISFSLASGCTRKILYLTPEVTGYLYDSKTKEPLHNVNGYISFYLPDEKSTTIKISNTKKIIDRSRNLRYDINNKSKELMKWSGMW